MEGRENQGVDENGERVPLFAEDEFYRSLADQQRRRTLAYLTEQGGSTVAELADVLCGWDGETMVGPEKHERVRVELEHHHLPVLDDAGLLAYVRQQGEVELCELDEAVTALVARSIAAEGT